MDQIGNIKQLFHNIQYTFNNMQLLFHALTHASIKPNKHFERLEFFGDRILNLIISEYLYNQYPNFNEGLLSKKLALCINKESLLQVAQKISLHEFMKFHREIIHHHNNRILCNGVESLIAAIYLDTTFDQTKCVVLKLWKEIIIDNSVSDVKTELQEMLQASNMCLPEYIVEKIDGVHHNPTFYIAVVILGHKFVGKGKSKKYAEMDAASQALFFLRKA